MPDALLSFSFLLHLVMIMHVLGSQLSLERFYIAGGTHASPERRQDGVTKVIIVREQIYKWQDIYL